MSKKIYMNNMNTESVSAIQSISDIIFAESIEMPRLAKAIKAEKSEISGLVLKTSGLVGEELTETERILENKRASLAMYEKQLENFKSYVSNVLYDKSSGRGSNKVTTIGAYSALGIDKDFADAYYCNDSARTKAVKELLSSFGLDLNMKLVSSFVKVLCSSVGLRATGYSDTSKGTLVKEQSVASVQKTFGRALVQYCGTNCENITVHSVLESCGNPETVVVNYNDDNTVSGFQIVSVNTITAEKVSVDNKTAFDERMKKQTEAQQKASEKKAENKSENKSDKTAA